MTYQLIRDWANERDIITESTSKVQFVKLLEEWSEIPVDPKDGIGDSLVVLTIIAAQYGINIEEHRPFICGATEIQALGALANAINKGKDPLKPLCVVYGLLHILPVDNGLSMDECLRHAYNEIKDRKGKMVAGTWVKECDL